ncbi:DNA primase family protein [Prosthecomicrobium hirschii]|nr:DNA primase family protein [Prosthecomicrobium hirschii]
MQGRRAKRRSFGIASGNAGKLDAMIGEAVPARAIALDAFDSNAMSFNVLNGTLHFTAVEVEDPDCPDPDVVRMKREWRAELRPHARADLISKLAPVNWDPAAECPVFDRFLARILPDDPVQGDALRAFMLRSLGLALTGLTTEQCFWLLYGGGQNGKSTLIDIVAQVLGDYACTVPVMSLVNDQPRAAGQPTPDLNPIAGARFVRSSEPKEGLPLDESLIKGLTGGEPIMLRRLNQEATEVRPKFKLFISVNHKPEIRGDDEGIWRRVRLVPFRVHIPREERDLDLPRKLEAEMPGILRRLVEGLLDYLQNGGLRPPPDVVEATEAYRKGEDDLGSFITAAVDITRREADEEMPGGLYAAYKVWAEREARPVMGKARFTRRLPETAERFGFERVKSSTSLYRGIRVRPEFFTPDRPGAFPSARGDDD